MRQLRHTICLHSPTNIRGLSNKHPGCTHRGGHQQELVPKIVNVDQKAQLYPRLGKKQAALATRKASFQCVLHKAA